ncbi:MAG: hypothetical protein JSU92_08920 [Deltaproteobacteria bacterium]|nr:MAG: hypothetical protein JSU92_08920 [Deltaproteobacteria bacterium]
MKAAALLSGGLDSSLAIKLVLNQGVEVTALNFITPFCLCDGKRGCRKKAVIIADNLNIELKMFNISEEYLEIVKNPRYGYGKNLNPCIDCRILMFKKTKEFMNESGTGFIITGEVLGQRPMSQNRKAMEIIERASGLNGLVVRPLSAKLFPPSIPEKEGWIKREDLLDIEGRSRGKQFVLTKELDISDYACPAGGCLLTDPAFSLRVKDLMISNMLSIDNINLIKNGRYLRINDSFKLIVGRNEEENQRLINLANDKDLVIEPESKGPVAIGRGEIEDNDKQIALKTVAYYCKDENVKINFSIFPEDKNYTIITDRMSEQELQNYTL